MGAKPPIELIEHGTWKIVDLAPGELDALMETKFVSVKSSVPGKCRITPGGKVGSVKVGTVQIDVRPKITELRRLLFFIGYCSNPKIWREEVVHLDKADGLFPAVSESFVRLAARAMEGGLLQGYRTKTESLQLVRGRIDFNEQITRRHGLPLPVAVEYDDFTTDIAENRIVLAAATALSTLPQVSADARHKLSRIRHQMDDVALPQRNVARPVWRPTRLNVRYHDVLRLSEVILDNCSFDQRSGSLAVTGFMFDMWKIYEDFVTSALSMAMRRHGGRAVTQGRIWMDLAKTILMKPDLIWYDASDCPVAVVDAKYKAERPKGFPEADIYQMLAYCSTLGLEEGHLIYAKGNGPVKTHKLVRSGITIHCRALDLGAPPTELLHEIDSIARAILHR
ncbi:McrC family protein [Nocardia abscessus]|uniref:McrC family protein n=1 Tax=Nocardia abscessus TaxID=120957 RepID=UPI002458FBEC|nr:restriction endonuclease [Nocardia abscessus]